jgi:hypothetical protein
MRGGVRQATIAAWRTENCHTAVHVTDLRASFPAKFAYTRTTLLADADAITSNMKLSLLTMAGEITKGYVS